MRKIKTLSSHLATVMIQRWRKSAGWVYVIRSDVGSLTELSLNIIAQFASRDPYWFRMRQYGLWLGSRYSRVLIAWEGPRNESSTPRSKS